MDVRKNLLDLHYHRYLQYFIATVIGLITYSVGIGIAIITGQVKTLIAVIILAEVSIVIYILGVVFLRYCQKHIKNIINEIKKL